jgi:hypothetical protein
MNEGEAMQLSAPIWMLLLLIMWICGPLIPAALTYRLAPAEKISVGGPILGKLSFKAGGVFAAYVISAGLVYGIAVKILDSLSSMMKPSWTVTATVKLVDEEGREINNPEWLQGLVVQLRPDYYSTANGHVIISMPELKTGLPDVMVSVPKFGSSVIDWSSVHADKDDYYKTITIKDPVLIHKVQPISAGLSVP